MRRATPEPPRLGVLPDFHLTERSGRMVGRTDMSGQPWVADFIFILGRGKVVWAGEPDELRASKVLVESYLGGG